MLKSKSIGACLALTFALLIGSGMTTYADTGAVNTEEVNTEEVNAEEVNAEEEDNTGKGNTEEKNTEEGSAQEAAEENSSSVVEAGTVRGAKKKAAAKAAEAAEEAAVEDKEQQPVVEAGASRRVEKSAAVQTEEADEEGAAEEQAETQEAAKAQEAAVQTPCLRSLGVFRTTGYCPCRQCSEGWGRHTCTGAIAQANHTIAVDPRVIPYGSQVMINGVIYTAEDRGGGVKGNHIDIFYDTHAQTRQHGSRNQEVFLLS